MSATDRDIYALAALFRELVQAREDQAVQVILTAYATLYDTLRDDLDSLLADVTRRREAGQVITIGQARRMERLEALAAAVEAEVTRIAGTADGLITAGQRDLVVLGDEHARQMILAGLGPGPGITLNLNRLPTNAIETMVGFLSPGTPLREALDLLPEMAGQTVRDELVRGIATGQHPRVVARRFRGAIGGNAASAERLARTAQLTAYRQANLATFRENPTIVRKWRWIAHLDDTRTCLSCIALHGQEFDLDTPQVDHWNGRCTQGAVTPTWSEILGVEEGTIPDARPVIASGEEWFASLPASKQRRIMGRSKYHAWQAGEVQFSDLSKVVDDPIFGPMRVEASLKDVLGADRARHWYAEAAAIERAAKTAA